MGLISWLKGKLTKSQSPTEEKPPELPKAPIEPEEIKKVEMADKPKEEKKEKKEKKKGISDKEFAELNSGPNAIYSR